MNKADATNKPHQQLPTAPGDTWGGQDLKRAFTAAAAWIARNAESINALNVFPVPDGDTGTNMALTMQAAVKQVAESPSHSAVDIAAGLSHGALMGARGNSGVILSQILRGFADGIAGKEQISARDFAAGLASATTMAYRAVLKPVEGTILTVVKDTGEAAQEAAQANSYAVLLDQICKAARASVQRTPTLLAKLRDAGVVDAGGQGFLVILEGIRGYAEGENLELATTGMAPTAAHELNGSGVHVEHGEYGYCTNFILMGEGWDFDEVRARIAALGDSAVIVGDSRIVKVHIHTETPGTVLNYATSLGHLRQISITDMQEQHEDFLESHGLPNAASAVRADAADLHALGRNPDEQVAQTKIAVLVVASGAGLVKAFRSMGAAAIVEGGQTMNPSTEDMLKAIERVPQDEVIILPNNGNIVMAARQTASLTKKKVAVVPTDTVPQGMAALIAMNYEASLDDNAKAMEAAARQVETGEITRAVRDARVDGLDVKEGSIIGLLNNKLVTTGEDRDTVAAELLDKMGAADRELITVYWGGDISEPDAQALTEQIQERFSNAEVELVHGGQPFYDYIISAE